MEQQAIKAALFGEWKKAIEINKSILKDHETDVEALGRLAYAYAKLGDFKKACLIYKKLLKIDPANPIALKNYGRYKEAKDCLNESAKCFDSVSVISPSLFLSDSSKAKSVDLINVASKNILQTLLTGDEVAVQIGKFYVRVKDKKGNYLGTFPDDIGRHLMRITLENRKIKYFLKDIREDKITIFIKWQ